MALTRTDRANKLFTPAVARLFVLIYRLNGNLTISFLLTGYPTIYKPYYIIRIKWSIKVGTQFIGIFPE